MQSADQQSNDIAIKGFDSTATLVREDIMACNTIIHVVDEVLISQEIADILQGGKISGEEGDEVDESDTGDEVDESDTGDTVESSRECGTVWANIREHPSLTSLKMAIKNANLVAALNDPATEVTFLAPTDDAFKVGVICYCILAKCWSYHSCTENSIYMPLTTLLPCAHGHSLLGAYSM